jgi:hypothetical protein
MAMLNKYNFKLALIRYVIPLILCLGLLIWSMKLYYADLRIPFNYSGDSLFFYAMTKTLMENGWVLHNRLLGAPFELHMYDFPLNTTLDLVITKLITFFVADHVLATNLFFLLTFPLTTLTSMVVFNQFKINYIYSLLGSLLFTFMPYHFTRGVSHLNLSPYFMVPLMVMVLLWIFLDEINLFNSDNTFTIKSILYSTKLKATILICILSGIIYFYYSYFFCFFLLITGILSSLKYGKKAPFLISIVLILLTSSVVILNQSPTIMYYFQNGSNPDAVVRSPYETEIYGLKIIQLLLPANGHRISILANLTRYYDSTAPLFNENATASLGMIGGLGFLILIAYVFFTGYNKSFKYDYDLFNLANLSYLNLSAVLFATIGGFSSIFAYVVWAQFRAVNRISIFIAFFSIFSILIVLKIFSYSYIKTFGSNKSIFIIAFVLLVVGIFDQTSDSFVPAYASIKEQYLIDEEFVNSIEAIMPEGAMIFQLPYIPFPQSAAINKMTEFSHLRGYLHSKDLHWSYGAMMGRSGDYWERLVASMPEKDMINTLSQFGFEGIYVDSDGFEDGGANLLSNISQILGVKPMASDNQRQFFFDMSNYKQPAKANSSENENAFIAFNAGWYDLENWSGISSRWMQSDATIEVYSSRNQTVNLCMKALSFYRNRTIEIYSGDMFVARVAVPTSFINVTASLPLATGSNVVLFHVSEGCERPKDKQELNNQDPRCVSIVVQNLTTEYI